MTAVKKINKLAILWALKIVQSIEADDRNVRELKGEEANISRALQTKGVPSDKFMLVQW